MGPKLQFRCLDTMIKNMNCCLSVFFENDLSMSNVIKFPAALKMLAATSGCPSRLILGDEKISSRIIVDLKREIITITLTQVNTLCVHLPVVDIGDDVSRLENCGGGRVGLHSGDPNQQTTWVLSWECWSW